MRLAGEQRAVGADPQPVGGRQECLAAEHGRLGRVPGERLARMGADGADALPARGSTAVLALPALGVVEPFENTRCLAIWVVVLTPETPPPLFF